MKLSKKDKVYFINNYFAFNEMEAEKLAIGKFFMAKQIRDDKI